MYGEYLKDKLEDIKKNSFYHQKNNAERDIPKELRRLTQEEAAVGIFAIK